MSNFSGTSGADFWQGDATNESAGGLGGDDTLNSLLKNPGHFPDISDFRRFFGFSRVVFGGFRSFGG